MSEKEYIILVGGGGHCHAVIDVIETEGKYQILGIVDNLEKESILGYPILGSDDDLGQLAKKCNNFMITVGQVSSAAVRVKLYEKIKSIGGVFPVVISPFAHVARTAIIGEGSVIMHNALVNTNAIVGQNNIINTGAIVEHDTKIGNNNHISTNSVLNGNCIVNNEVFLGSGTVVVQGKKICSKVTIGAASLVTKDINLVGLFYGIPVKGK